MLGHGQGAAWRQAGFSIAAVAVVAAAPAIRRILAG